MLGLHTDAVLTELGVSAAEIAKLRAADAVLLDLEDALHPDAKAAAREVIVSFLARSRDLAPLQKP